MDPVQPSAAGVGTALVERLCAAVPGQHVGLQTDDALAFYRRLGFTDQPRFLSKVVGRWLADSPGAAPHRPDAPTADVHHGPGDPLSDSDSDPDPDPDRVSGSVAAYSARADRYEADHAMEMADRVERFSRSLAAPALVLDAGCGPGRDLVRFAAHGHLPRGIDLNPVFAARAARHAPTWRADLRSLDRLFPAAGLFDGVWAAASLVHLTPDEVDGVLGHFARLVRSGGRLYACVAASGLPGWRDEEDGRRWYNVWDPDGFATAVDRAGFAPDAVDRGPFVEVWATRTP